MAATSDFLPTREADLYDWSVNFKTLISATPTAYGLTAPQATAYATAHGTFANAYRTAVDPSTRTPPSIVAKNDAKQALIAMARELARLIQATPTVTNEQRADLGLTVRDSEPTPIPPPEFAPGVTVVSRSGRTVRIRLQDVENPTNRGRPGEVKGATVFSFVGAEPPVDVAGWKFEGNTSRTSVDVEFPPTVAPGTQVWITAMWFNAKSQSGPPATPITAYIDSGLSMAA